ncbi:MAG: xylose isomerase [Candidatus Handelsmanbacteria bacterium RIFCSPLOWO2_12_FULL_64_10]|uniref:Xylose isomerase n=1 Tax=Handelsmanbacteria sp. (strain RIFCSPLOWO2_12_FULL_64_10) TaxID=1817868 RepID=A0A1F6CYU6_HANXR|nr:MAG: xylose isomerase [Candidatus Handelsmanbacteria bacterium RIFCSPLOWO2_12_FULL_64_10]
MRIKQSICYPLFKPQDMNLEGLFKTAAEIGYAAVELWGRGEDFEEIMALAKRHRLAVASMSGHASLPDGLNKRSNHDRIEAELKASIDIAVRHGIPGLICFSGNRQPYQSEVEAIEAVADGLRRVAPYAEQKGVNLNLELLNSKVDHPGYQCDHTTWGVAVCERVGSPRVKLLYDIYHMQIMEGDVIRTLRENIRWIGHFHTAGNPGRRDMDDTQELNYAGICKAIAGTGYDLYVGHEFRPKGDPVESLKQTFAVCHQG